MEAYTEDTIRLAPHTPAAPTELLAPPAQHPIKRLARELWYCWDILLYLWAASLLIGFCSVYFVSYGTQFQAVVAAICAGGLLWLVFSPEQENL